MKKFAVIAFLLCVGGVSAYAWNKYITIDKTPQSVQSFMMKYFSNTKIMIVEEDSDEYEVTLENGLLVEFYKDGTWKKVENKKGYRGSAPTVIPDALLKGELPAAVLTYIDTNFKGAILKEVKNKGYIYEVELLNGIEITFNKDGQFVGYDD